MKRAWVSADGEVFESKADCEAYEKNCKPPVTLPWELFREVIRQCSPYLVSAESRYALRDQLVKLAPVEVRRRLAKKERG